MWRTHSTRRFRRTTPSRRAGFPRARPVAAAVFGGLAAGFLIYVADSLDKTIPRHDAIAAASTLAAAVVLAAAALYLERCCRAPEPPGDEEFPRPGGEPTGFR